MEFLRLSYLKNRISLNEYFIKKAIRMALVKLIEYKFKLRTK